MTERHIHENHRTLVNDSLRGIARRHPYANVIPSLKVCYNSKHEKSKVALISGGGSGHEPFSGGYVGKGFLSASASGDVFASPSARQVYGAVKSVPSNEGTILIITNYTGDNLHFGLAAQQARADGVKNIDILPVTDDVSVGRKGAGLVGRRALAGTVLVCKILGAASDEGMSYKDTLNLGREVNSAMVSCAVALDHTHVPGRADFPQIPKDTVEIGLGLHNEPGRFVLSPQPTAKELHAKLLDLLCNPDDEDRAFVKFNKDDEVVLLCNNMGGMSTLEMNATADETVAQLQSDWNINPVRTIEGTFVTAMNMPGMSLTLLNVSQISKNTGLSTSHILNLIDAEHGALAFPNGCVWKGYPDIKDRPFEEKLVDAPAEHVEQDDHSDKPSAKLQVNSKTLQTFLRSGAQAALDSEPDLTKWDTICGDGDAGESVALGAQAVLKALDSGLGADGDVVEVLRSLTHIIDDSMGGTLGAIFSIFLAGLTAEARDAAATATIDNFPWGKVALAALETLKRSTAARKGHRTVMDALIPLAEEMAATNDFTSAVAACKAGGEGTVTLTPKLGRATYVGEREGGLPPDPGAMAVVRAMEGITKALA